MRPKGTFMLLRASQPPSEVLMAAGQHDLYRDRMAVCGESLKARKEVYRLHFGDGILQALPAWSTRVMVQLANTYEGPFQVEVRGMAACIASDVPYGHDDEGKHDGGGGHKVPLIPEPTLQPDGGAEVPLFDFNS